MELRSAPELQKYILHNVKRTEKSLGSGSFGIVQEVEYNHVLCAGKKIHENLLHAIGNPLLIKKFEQECKLLKELRFPHIVQFFGIHFYDNCNSPVLIMELLSMNVDDWLSSQGNKQIPLSLKSSILQDTAKGLHHLHTHDPLIIHRDLTARNVLLTSSMVAKIADLGNACIVPPHQLTKTMTRVPGTMAYMPPEAHVSHAHYTEKLDIFSFGHLALCIMVQEKHHLWAATEVDPNDPSKVIGHSEIERRSEYFNNLYQRYAKSHDIPMLIETCLHLMPTKRPSAKEIIEVFKSFLNEHRDEYIALEGLNRFEMAEKLKEKEFEDSGSERYEKYKIDEAREKIKNSANSPLMLEIRKERPGRLHRIVPGQWKKYSFCYDTESGNLKYYGDVNKGPRQVVNSDKFERVLERQESCEFEIHIRGRGSWILKTSTEEERTAWMEILRSENVDSCSEDDRVYDYVKPNPAYGLSATHLEHDRSSDDLRQQKPVYETIDTNSKDLPQVYHLPVSPRRSLSSRKEKKKDPTQPDDTKQFIGPSLVPPPPPEIRIEAADTTLNQTTDDKKSKIDVPKIKEKRHSRRITVEQLDLINEMMSPITIGGRTLGLQQPQPYYDDVIQNMYSSQQSDPDEVSRGTDQGAYVNMDEVDSTYDTISDGDELYDTIDDPPCSTPPLPPKPAKLQHHSKRGKPATKPKPKPKKPPLVRKRTLDQIAVSSTQVSTDMLITGDGDDYSDPRPLWAKASTVNIQLDDNDKDTLAMLNLDPKLIRNSSRFASGNFGDVYKATLETPHGRGVEVAVKSVNRQCTEKEKKDFLAEMMIMTTMLHPNIVYLHGLVLEANLIVLEFLPNGDLGTFLKNNSRPIRTKIKYMIDIAMGMHHLSLLGLVHRDLAARNVLVGENEICKVADFGLIRSVEQGVYHGSKSKVPIRWCAPECLTQKKYTPASDVWSYGIVLWEIHNPTLFPYPHYEDYLVGSKIAEGEKLAPPSAYPKIVQQIMQACWQIQPDKRPSFRYITGLLTRVNLEGLLKK